MSYTLGRYFQPPSTVCQDSARHVCWRVFIIITLYLSDVYCSSKVVGFCHLSLCPTFRGSFLLVGYLTLKVLYLLFEIARRLFHYLPWFSEKLDLVISNTLIIIIYNNVCCVRCEGSAYRNGFCSVLKYAFAYSKTACLNTFCDVQQTQPCKLDWPRCVFHVISWALANKIVFLVMVALTRSSCHFHLQPIFCKYLVFLLNASSMGSTHNSISESISSKSWVIPYKDLIGEWAGQAPAASYAAYLAQKT